MFNDFVTIVVGIVGIILTVVYIVSSERTLRRRRDKIMQEPDLHRPPRPSDRGAKPTTLSPDEKIEALYQLSKRQGRFQFISNLAWAVFGIIGGYLAGHFLPH